MKFLIGVFAAGNTPVHKLSDIYATLANFAFMNEYMRNPKFGSEIPLCEPSLLPHHTKQRRQATISWCMLGFCHAYQYRADDTCYRMDNRLSLCLSQYKSITFQMFWNDD